MNIATTIALIGMYTGNVGKLDSMIYKIPQSDIVNYSIDINSNAFTWSTPYVTVANEEYNEAIVVTYYGGTNNVLPGMTSIYMLNNGQYVLVRHDRDT